MNFSDPNGTPAGCPTPFNLAGYVLEAGTRIPDKVALETIGSSNESLSYGELTAAVMGTARGLLDMGLTPGDRVLMRLGNTVHFPIAYLGAIAAGLVAIPTSAALTEPEIAGIADETRPAAIIADAGIALPHQGIPTVTVDQLEGFFRLSPAEAHMADPNRPAYIIYTSGTSGVPRAVEHAHRAIWARRMMHQGWYGLRDTDRLCHAGAFNWTYTLGTGLLDPWTLGATALIPTSGTRSDALPELLKRHEATLFAAAPGIFRQMLKGNARIDIPGLRHGLSAGEKLPERLRAAWQGATGCNIYEAFGMTECSTFISGAPDRPAPDGTLGFVQSGRRVALLDEAGRPAPKGVTGTISVHANDPGLMLGYLDHPEETAARMRGNWFLTGDTGFMRDDGSIEYHGRTDDMMNAGGYRVSPIEVETALTDHAAITDAAAVEVSVKADTRVIAAFYVTNRALDEAEIKAHIETRLARYKTPRLFIHVPDLPRGANGKLQRRILRETYEAGHGQT
jgi:acyl-coenzyme A synthetase/AMP-(fatty) acid ligase